MHWTGTTRQWTGTNNGRLAAPSGSGACNSFETGTAPEAVEVGVAQRPRGRLGRQLRVHAFKNIERPLVVAAQGEQARNVVAGIWIVSAFGHTGVERLHGAVEES